MSRRRPLQKPSCEKRVDVNQWYSTLLAQVADIGLTPLGQWTSVTSLAKRRLCAHKCVINLVAVLSACLQYASLAAWKLFRQSLYLDIL